MIARLDGCEMSNMLISKKVVILTKFGTTKSFLNSFII